MRIVNYCAAVLIVLTAIGCEKSAEEKTETTSTTRPNAMRNVRTAVVTLQSFRKTIAATGTVAFNQNKSTQVLSPISGPVARILANIGSRVSRGEPLAVV